MKDDKVMIQDSPIEGKGVFATRDFKKGEVVLRWDITHTITTKELENKSEEEKRYVSFLNGAYIIMQEPERYVNHSCEPNTTAQEFCDIALKDIAKGEEITANYEEELPPGTEMKCNCKSKNCRHLIRSKE